MVEVIVTSVYKNKKAVLNSNYFLFFICSILKS